MKDMKTFKETGFLLDKLHLIQDEQGYIDEKSIELIADELNMSKAEIYGAATYYKNFTIHAHNHNHNYASSISYIPDNNISYFGVCSISETNNSAAPDNCNLNNLNNNKLNIGPNLSENQNKIINNPLDLNLYKLKSDFVFKRFGKIDPNSLDDYRNHGGFKAIENVLYLIKNRTVFNDTNNIDNDTNNNKINNGANNIDKGTNNNIDKNSNSIKNKSKNKNNKNIIIDVLKQSGLRGRGGAGFPVDIKWETVFNAQSIDTYVVCNSDEGDKGAFIDRLIIENDPFMLIEGIIIAAITIGAELGFIYVRSDYQNGIERLRNAINLCYQTGYLGDNIFNSNNNFDLKLIEAGGNYVCGEETALLESIENKRGMARVRPPVPAISGLYGKPTILNNVTTFASVSYIFGNLNIDKSDRLDKLDKSDSLNKSVNLNDLKIEQLPFPFQLSGTVKNAGIYELSNEITIKYLIYDMGGGSADKRKKLKAVQIGGSLGAFFPLTGVYGDEFYNLKLNYEDIADKGGILGHGGVVVYDEDASMKDLLKETLNFCVEESCGKCAPCRIGSIRLKELFERIFKENISNKIKTDKGNQDEKDNQDNKNEQNNQNSKDNQNIQDNKNEQNNQNSKKDNKVENTRIINETKSKIIKDNLDIIYEILETMKNLSLCGFGSGICLPVESLLKYFGDEILN